MSAYCPEGCPDADACVVGHPCALHPAEPRELALRLDNGTLVRDSSWRCVADVLGSFHGFGARQAYGTIVYADTGEIHPHHKPDHPASTVTNQPLG